MSLWFGNVQSLAPPVIVGSVSTDNIGTAGSATFAHTVPAGTTCLIVGFAYTRNDPTDATSVTFNGVAMTEAVDALSTVGSIRGRAGWYYLLNPTPATANVVATFTGSVDDGGCVAVNLGSSTAATPGTGSSALNSGRTSATCSVTATRPALVFFATAAGRNAVSLTQDGDTNLYADGNSTCFWNFGYRSTQGGIVDQPVTIGASTGLTMGGIAIYG
jgi:hypothetical protein